MRLKMAENSVFAYLLRSPWWVSMLAALVYALAIRVILPEKYFIFGASFSVPLFIIGLIAAWKQAGVPSESRVASTVEKVTAMNWREFKLLLQQAFEREGFSVKEISGAADFSLHKEGRITLVCCKRWKAASHGTEALIALETLCQESGAQRAIYVATGLVSEKASRYARDNGIALMTGLELTRLLRLR